MWLINLLHREQIAVLTVRQDDSTEIDLTALEARLKLALEGLTEFDEVGRLAGQAHKTLERHIDIGGKARLKVRENLTHSITMLHASEVGRRTAPPHLGCILPPPRCQLRWRPVFLSSSMTARSR